MWPHAGNHIVGNAFGSDNGIQCPHSVAPTMWVAAYGVVYLLKAIKREGYGAQTGPYERLHTLTCEQHSVCNNSPRIAPLVEFTPHRFEVVAAEGLATGDNHHHPVGVHVWGDLVNGSQEIFGGHIGHSGTTATIATAVAAVEVATQCTLPENLAQLVLLCEVLFDVRKEIERVV